MPLDLQLHRVQSLLRHLNNPHYKPKFIHVAGTNGKGSVCSYISHILTEAGIKNGRFNSPHLITPRDSIQINNLPVSRTVYEKFKVMIQDIDKKYNVGCTEFELLTCTAFQIFAECNVDIAIMEVGVGGRLDATNVIPAEKTMVVGITKIALDHQGLLGNNLREIASQKLGIFKKDVPAVIDGTNDKSVLEEAEKEAKHVGCNLYVTKKEDCWVKPKLLGNYQYDNLAVALKMISLVEDYSIGSELVKTGVEKTIWPGRLQTYKLEHAKIDINDDGFTPVLLDGAHNTSAANELGKYLGSIRGNSGFVYVIAITKGKDLTSLFQSIINENDIVIFTQFAENIEGMPWIEPFLASELRDELTNQAIPLADIKVTNNVKDALKIAIQISQKENKKIVVCGSLYLVADVFRL